VRHRLARAGNRQINRTLHIMATVQLRNPTEGRAYFDREKAAGKTSMEAMRCLKRPCPTWCTATWSTTPSRP
jgi:transposase